MATVCQGSYFFKDREKVPVPALELIVDMCMSMSLWGNPWKRVGTKANTALTFTFTI